MQAVFDLKEYYYRKWRKANGLNCLKYWILHQETKAHLRRLVLRRRKETWYQFCDQMERGEFTKAIAKFCKIRKNRNLRPSFSSIEGPQHAANTMASHLKSVFSGQLLHDASHESVRSPISLGPFDEDSPFTLESIQEYIQKLPPKKAPSIDHIRREMLVPILDLIAPVLLFLFRLCWTWSKYR